MGKKTKTTSGPSAAAMPYLTQASSALTGAYNGNAANTANITNLLNSNIGTVLGQTLNNPTLSAASTYDQNVLGSSADPMSNPYMAGIINQTNRNVTDQVNSAIGTRGLTGGSAQTQLLAKSLADADNQALFGQYNTNVANQNTAASNAASLAGAQNSGISTLMSYLTGTNDLPMQNALGYAQGLDGLWGNSQTTTQSLGLGSTLGSLLGAGLAGWASGGFKMASDRRLKTDIIKIAEEPDGLGIYQYRYKAGGPLRTGVMADEVARVRPWALGPSIEGVATVDYGKL